MKRQLRSSVSPLRWALCLSFLACSAFIACTPSKARCMPANCNGCCDSVGICQPGDGQAACGVKGSACGTCAPSQSCLGGTCKFTPVVASCDPSSCTGCCSPAGCEPGDSNEACGARGSSCAYCSTGTRCQQGSCTEVPLTLCGPTNCAGCCENGTCVTPVSATACGAGGKACQACSGNQSCSASGECVSASCSGCVDPTGQCQTGTSTAACGGQGKTCVECPGVEQCVNGTCTVPVPTCNSGNCAGCCSGTTCVLLAQQSEAQCGKAGAACAGCATGSVCSQGSCSAAPSGCNAQNCPNGCCTSTNPSAICYSGTTTAHCGTGGVVCSACGTGTSCQNRSCAVPPPPPKTVGSSCTSNAECASLGGNYTCKLSTSSGNASYPGGYCTVICNSTLECPGTTSCVNLNPSYGESDRICWQDCSSTSCRSPGYACYTLNGGEQGCWLGTLPTLDAGPPAPADLIGSPCTTQAACRNPPDNGECILATGADGGSTGYTGGYCSAGCDATGDEHCGAGGLCVAFQSGSYCMRQCSNPLGGQGTSCRTGYVCGSLKSADGGMSPNGLCEPRCDNSAGICPTGYTCTTSGTKSGYCCSGTHCL